jgi:hypothetical protein
MEIIDSGINRGVLDVNDMFIRYLTKDGINRYPTIIFLMNRLFLREYERIGAHEYITEIVRLGDDVRWYKTKGVDEITRTMDTVFTPDIFTDINYFKPDPDQSHDGIFNYWYTGNRFYINSGGQLKESTIGPLDKNARVIALPSGTGSDSHSESAFNIIDICRLNGEADLILTSTRIYLYKPSSQSISIRVPVKDHTHYKFNAICCTTQYVVIACSALSGSGMGFYVVTNIDSDEEINYKCPLYHSYYDPDSGASTNNGLSSNNNYTVCIPASGDRVEVNGVGGLVYFDCGRFITSGYEEGYSSGRGTQGVSSRNFGNENILYGPSKAFVGGKTFTINNAYQYYSYGGYYMVVGKDNLGLQLLIHNDKTLTSNKPLLLQGYTSLPQDITNCYVLDREHIYLFTSSGKTYVSRDKADPDNAIIAYPLSFNFDLESETKRANVVKIIMTVLDVIDILCGGDNSRWTTVNGQIASFIFIRILLYYGKANWYCFGDDNRRSTVFRDMVKAFDTY